MGDTPENEPVTTTEEPAATQSDTTDYKAEAEKWKTLARKHESRAKENADAAKRVAEIDEANKTAEQKAVEAQQRADAAEARAMRYEVAADKALPKDALKFLSGSSREELEASADELMQLMAARDKAAGAGTAGGGKPQEKLRPGSNPDANKSDEESVESIVAKIPRF